MKIKQFKQKISLKKRKESLQNFEYEFILKETSSFIV